MLIMDSVRIVSIKNLVTYTEMQEHANKVKI